LKSDPAWATSGIVADEPIAGAQAQSLGVQFRGKFMSVRAVCVLAFIVAAVATPQAAGAEVLKFHAMLDGKYGSEPTGSPATGHANVRVDTVTHRVSVDLHVAGITVDQLWAKLVARPIGPIHFHNYTGGGSALALPLPYGAAYHPKRDGIHVVMKDFDYAADAALVNSKLDFDAFVAGMKSGVIILNVHTNKFNPGEISGLVVPD
jgi:hypothetical protein